MEIPELHSDFVSPTALSVFSLFVDLLFLFGVAVSVKLGRHHHCLLFVAAVGLSGAVWAQGLGEKSNKKLV
jgi:hypothetical protein